MRISDWSSDVCSSDLPDLKLTWGEFTGRLGLDWKTRLGFTDQTLLYAFYSRGYKGGGVNPPSPGFATPEEMIEAGVLDQATDDLVNAYSGMFPIPRLNGAEYGRTLKPEYVNTCEIGRKKRSDGGRTNVKHNDLPY